MISLLICSVDSHHLTRIKENICSTIGVEYELLVWDNTGMQIGLCEVYNSLAARAKYGILVFLHEDISISTPSWGKKILNYFDSDLKLGMLGVAGSRFKSRTFSGWYTGIKKFDCVNITHRYIDRDEVQFLHPEDLKVATEVVCIDGVFMACKASICQQVQFDSANLKGFHFYDIDFSLRSSVISKIICIYDLDIIHITKGGDFGNKWVDECIPFHQRSMNSFPVTKLFNSQHGISTRIARTWLDVLKRYDISFRNKVRWINSQKLYLMPLLYYAIIKFFLYKPLRMERFRKRQPS